MRVAALFRMDAERWNRAIDRIQPSLDFFILLKLKGRITYQGIGYSQTLDWSESPYVYGQTGEHHSLGNRFYDLL